MNFLKKFILILFQMAWGVFLISCASTEEPVSRAHPAAYSMDTFQIEQGMPVREVKKQEFYFKHCELETRRAFTSKAEFSCNER